MPVVQIQCIIGYLVVYALAVLFITDLELQQENNVPIKHDRIHPFSYVGDRVLEDDPAVRKCT